MRNLAILVSAIMITLMSDPEIIKLNRKFGYVVAGALLFIAAFQYVFKHKQDTIVFCIAIILLLFTLIKPVWLTPLRIVWDKIGHILGIINTYVLLTLFYVVILTPLSLVMRLFGKDILKLKYAPRQSSYWETPPAVNESKMENQF
jgi:hypothetical protein